MTLGTLIDHKTAYEDLPEVLTPKEDSEYLRMHVKSIRYCITDGRLCAFRNGIRYYVRKDWLRDFQNSMTVAPPNPNKLATNRTLRRLALVMATNADKAFSRTWVCWQSSKTFINLPKYAIRVLIAIAQFQQGSSLPTYSTTSYARISEVTRIGKADISHAVIRLKEDGFIEVTRRTSKGTCYRLNPPPYAHDDEVAYAPNQVVEPPNPQVALSPNPSVGCANNLSVGDGSQPIKNAINEITNHQEQASSVEENSGFRTLWRAWPVKWKPVEAEEMYSRVISCGVNAEVLLSIAENYVRGFEGEYRFVPGLARWLDPDDIGGWCEAMKEKRARRKAALLRNVSDEDLQAALAACDPKFAQIQQESEEDPLGTKDGKYVNRDIAYAYFVQHRQRAQDAITRDRLDEAGLVDIKHLSAFD